MNELGPVSKYLESELREQARQHGIVFWLDPEGHFVSYADGLKQRADAGAFPFPTRCFRGSYLQLMRELDGLADGVSPRPMLVHVPGVSEEELRRTPLLELYRAGERKSFELPKLVQDAAYGRCTARELEGFLAGEALTLEAADAWLKRVDAGAAGAAGAVHDYSALSATALLGELLPGGTIHDKASQPGAEAAVWKRAEVLLGLSPEKREKFRYAARRQEKLPASDMASGLVLELFRYEFRSAMAAMALPEVLLARFGIYHPEAYAPTNDRGIVGSMLDYRKMFEHMVEAEGRLARAPIAEINAKLNDTPMSVLGMDCAAERIDSLVEPDASLLH